MKQIEAKRTLIRAPPGLTDARDFVIAHQNRDVRCGDIKQLPNQSCFNNEGFVDDVYLHHGAPDSPWAVDGARKRSILDISYGRSHMNAMTASRIMANRKWTAAILIVAAIWFGMLLGVSFLATPAKFLAPSLSLPVALDVGGHTFAVFNKIEWLLSVVLVAAVLAGDRRWLSTSAIGVVIFLVGAETFWLLPQLDQRVGMIIAGQQPPPSNLHNLYIAFEVVKLLVLIVVLLVMAKRLAGPSSDFYFDGSEAR